MRGQGIVAVAVALTLGSWAGPAHAWAPAPIEPASVEVDEGAEPLEDATDPALEAGEDAVDPATDPAAQAEATAPAVDSPAASPAAPARTHDVPADDFEAEPSVAPGGYYGHGVILERAPPDGQRRIIVGSILVPLGTIATVSSAVGTWLTVPAHCERRLGAAGIEADGSRCQGLFTFNLVRVSYGALMLASGATILALGIIQRERYRKWRHEHGMRARLEPVLGLPGRGAASLGLRLRF